MGTGGTTIHARSQPSATQQQVSWIRSSKRSTMQCAIQRGDLAGVRAALRNGAAVNGSELDAHTPLQVIASSRGHLAIVELMLDAGADKDKRSPLPSAKITTLLFWVLASLLSSVTTGSRGTPVTELVVLDLLLGETTAGACGCSKVEAVNGSRCGWGDILIHIVLVVSIIGSFQQLRNSRCGQVGRLLLLLLLL